MTERYSDNGAVPDRTFANLTATEKAWAIALSNTATLRGLFNNQDAIDELLSMRSSDLRMFNPSTVMDLAEADRDTMPPHDLIDYIDSCHQVFQRIDEYRRQLIELHDFYKLRSPTEEEQQAHARLGTLLRQRREPLIGLIKHLSSHTRTLYEQHVIERKIEMSSVNAHVAIRLSASLLPDDAV